MSDHREPGQEILLAEIALASAEDKDRRLHHSLAERGIGAWQVPFTVRASARRVEAAREQLELARAGAFGRATADLAARVERVLALGDLNGRLVQEIAEPHRADAVDLCLGIQLLLGQTLADEQELIRA